MPLNVQPDPVEHSAPPSGVRNRLQRYDWAIARPETILKLEVVEGRAVKMCPEGAFIAGHLRMARARRCDCHTHSGGSSGRIWPRRAIHRLTGEAP